MFFFIFPLLLGSTGASRVRYDRQGLLFQILDTFFLILKPRTPLSLDAWCLCEHFIASFLS